MRPCSEHLIPERQTYPKHTFKGDLRDSVPRIRCGYRAFNADKRRRIARLVNKLTGSGQRIPSDSEWSPPLVLVPKPAAEGILCTDHRPLEKVRTVPEYPSPLIHEALGALRDKVLLSVFGFLNAYWQVGPITQFASVHSGSFRRSVRQMAGMNVLGTAAAPATQRRMIARLLPGTK